LLSTGNLNENTAQFYTDHILITANPLLLREAESLFLFLKKRKRAVAPNALPFNHLLVSPFNLQKRFMELIDREMSLAHKGLPAAIVIKMNNLEDKVLISKLYDASQAGVRITLIVRSICCLVPGVNGMSENIRVIRIIDRYLEHGRVFVFNNNGKQEVFLGSADWMNRNIYRRIEVCFPIYDLEQKAEILRILSYQLKDSVQAVHIDPQLNNVPVAMDTETGALQSQKSIGDMLAKPQATKKNRV
jgi:polyphosphate kinase